MFNVGDRVKYVGDLYPQIDGEKGIDRVKYVGDLYPQIDGEKGIGGKCMRIQSITYRDDHGIDNTYDVGVYGVKEIIEHSAQGEGDKWFYDVKTENEVIRLFEFIRVTFTKKKGKYDITW